MAVDAGKHRFYLVRSFMVNYRSRIPDQDAADAVSAVNGYELDGRVLKAELTKNRSAV